MPKANEIWRLPPVHWVALVLGCYLLHRLVEPAGLFPQWSRPAAYGLFALGALICGVTVIQFLRRRTNIHAFRDPQKLITTGMFAYSRNPIYLGLTIMMMGVGLYFNTPLGFAPVVVFFVLANFWYAPSEERAAARVFGEEYAAYRRKVRRWL